MTTVIGQDFGKTPTVGDWIAGAGLVVFLLSIGFLMLVA